MATENGPLGGQVVGKSNAGKPIYASHLNTVGQLAHGARHTTKAEAAAPRPAVFRVTHGRDGLPIGPAVTPKP